MHVQQARDLWLGELTTNGASPWTIRNYTAIADAAFTSIARRRGVDAADLVLGFVDRDDVVAALADHVEVTDPTTGVTRRRSQSTMASFATGLRSFFSWCVESRGSNRRLRSEGLHVCSCQGSGTRFCPWPAQARVGQSAAIRPRFEDEGASVVRHVTREGESGRPGWVTQVDTAETGGGGLNRPGLRTSAPGGRSTSGRLRSAPSGLPMLGVTSGPPVRRWARSPAPRCLRDIHAKGRVVLGICGGIWHGFGVGHVGVRMLRRPVDCMPRHLTNRGIC